MSRVLTVEFIITMWNRSGGGGDEVMRWCEGIRIWVCKGEDVKDVYVCEGVRVYVCVKGVRVCRSKNL